jgi:hypothetical protein
MKLTDIIHQIGDRVRIAARVTALTGGTRAVDAVVVTNGGTGYTSAPTVSFSGGGGSGAAGTAVIAGGKVISVTMTAAGTGYTSTPTVGFSGGGGSGAVATAIMLALDLDAIPTAGLSLTPAPLAFLLLSGRVNPYRLRAGTDAENSPFIIRPDDYAGTTNEKVWEFIGVNALEMKHELRTLTYAASVALDFDASALQTVSLTGNITFTTSNRGAGKSIRVRVVADASVRNFTFPGGWKFIGAAAPASIAANKTALLTLTGFGANDSDVTAEYVVEP